MLLAGEVRWTRKHGGVDPRLSCETSLSRARDLGFPNGGAPLPCGPLIGLIWPTDGCASIACAATAARQLSSPDRKRPFLARQESRRAAVLRCASARPTPCGRPYRDHGMRVRRRSPPAL